MFLRFGVAVVAFHAVMTVVSLLVAARLDVIARSRRGGYARAAAVAALFVLAGIVAGLAASAWAPMPGFTALRLWCQGLFGEGVALCLWAALVTLRSGRRFDAVTCLAIAGALVGVYWQAYHREPGQLRVRRHEVALGDAPRPSRRVSVAHVSDVQAAEIGAHEERALRAVLHQRPDVIVFTGDYVQERTSPRASGLRELARDFNALVRRVRVRAALGVYATEGDIGLPCATVFAGTSVRCLVDECVAVAAADGSRLAIAGLSTAASRGRDRGRILRVVASCPPADRVIVAGHRPDFVSVAAADGRVHLALAGHTHGGQVVVPLFGPPLTLTALPRRFAGGLNHYAGIPLHVSRGVGMERGTAPQIRFLCPPEVCLLDVSF